MSSINIEKISTVHWYPELECHRCGYCKSENGSVSYGMWAEQLTVEDYQNLIDRGWRRSGMYCYKPMMDQTCCPQYTIRCNVLNFQPSKSQKKVIKKFNKYFTEGQGPSTEPGSDVLMQENCSQEEIIIKERPQVTVDYSKLVSANIEHTENKSETIVENAGCSHTNPEIENIHNDPLLINEKRPLQHNFKKGVGADPNKPKCKKAKLLRLEQKQQKGLTLEKQKKSVNEAKTLGQLLNEIPENSKHKLKIKYEKMHKNHPTFKACSGLFQKYQMYVHNESINECNEKQFNAFLVSSPLKSVRVRSGDSSVTFGTFHQQYWLDDKLIAVAVLDILPRCVSSVYFFYDPDYRFLTLGTYGSLREIQYVQSLNKSIPTLNYYYMGYYIHSCPKMRYKGKLNGSDLLCPETYQWFPIERCIPKLDINKYSRLNDDLDAIDQNLCTKSDIDHIKVCDSYSFTKFANYKQKFGEQDVFDNIGKLVGKKAAANLLFFSSKTL